VRAWPLLLVLALPAAAEDWLRVAAADHPITVEASGLVASADTLRFGPPPSRSWRKTITNITREGSRVDAGDVLVQFDSSGTDDRIRSLRADLNAKRSELESLLEQQAREQEEDKVRLAEARSAAEKAARKAAVGPEVYASLEYRKLLEEKAIAAELYRREQERGELVERVREARRAELRADIRRLESELDGAQAELESFTIRAPRDGLVILGTDREGQKLDVNDNVNPGMVVVELAQLDDLVVQAEVPEYAAARLAVGQPAQVTLDAGGGSALGGEIVAVASIVRRQSQYSQAMVRDVTVRLDEVDGVELRPGMSAKLTLVIERRRQALAVPDQALQYRGGRPGVVVRGEGWRPVLLGGESAGLRIVTEGLEAGAEVRLL
jgi:multidrug efflux pump subunit AcrA (membrane-fusion protein)